MYEFIWKIIFSLTNEEMKSNERDGNNIKITVGSESKRERKEQSDGMDGGRLKLVSLCLCQ